MRATDEDATTFAAGEDGEDQSEAKLAHAGWPSAEWVTEDDVCIVSRLLLLLGILYTLDYCRNVAEWKLAWNNTGHFTSAPLIPVCVAEHWSRHTLHDEPGLPTPRCQFEEDLKFHQFQRLPMIQVQPGQHAQRLGPPLAPFSTGCDPTRSYHDWAIAAFADRFSRWMWTRLMSLFRAINHENRLLADAGPGPHCGGYETAAILAARNASQHGHPPRNPIRCFHNPIYRFLYHTHNNALARTVFELLGRSEEWFCWAGDLPLGFQIAHAALDCEPPPDRVPNTPANEGTRRHPKAGVAPDLASYDRLARRPLVPVSVHLRSCRLRLRLGLTWRAWLTLYGFGLVSLYTFVNGIRYLWFVHWAGNVGWLWTLGMVYGFYCSSLAILWVGLWFLDPPMPIMDYERWNIDHVINGWDLVFFASVLVSRFASRMRRRAQLSLNQTLAAERAINACAVAVVRDGAILEKEIVARRRCCSLGAACCGLRVILPAIEKSTSNCKQTRVRPSPRRSK
jgi:hypothetical protein